MESRSVWDPDGAPASGPAGVEALVLRALGDAYADRSRGSAEAAWPTPGELTARAALDPEVGRRALHGLERRGLLRVRSHTPRTAAGVRSPPAVMPQPAGAIGPPPPTAASGPYNAGGSTPRALASLRTVDG